MQEKLAVRIAFLLALRQFFHSYNFYTLVLYVGPDLKYKCFITIELTMNLKFYEQTP